MKAEDEDRILRVWTPVILRTVLVAAGIVLIAGIIAISLTPGEYAMHFRAMQHNAHVKDYLTFGHLRRSTTPRARPSDVDTRMLHAAI